ncbi:MAG TPA: ExeM/NucH family extracellular endonuclease, partial [Anaerolineae bacterium]|nr:ExeM/NucH family extracellular endonuclease [Anaerolineae bacterium]
NTPAPGLSNTTAAIRAGNGATDTNNNAADFATGSPNPRNSSFGFDAAPSVATTTPADGAIDVALAANVDLTFSEPVNVNGAWFEISCSLSGIHTAVVSGGPISFTLDPDLDFAIGDLCTVKVIAASVTDQDTEDPPDTMAADYTFSFTTTAPPCTTAFTPIYDIQGSGPDAAITGIVSTEGVVVGDYEGSQPTLRGFYLQDRSGDGNPATSDGIFVFNGNNDNVSLGQVVRVTGTAGEFQGQTQLSNVTSIVDCGETASITPVDVTLPFPSANFAEQYEGMLVRLPQTLYVTEHFQLGRFGQVVMSADSRLSQPTNVTAPGAPALALQAANDLNRIIIDDALNDQNPDPILFGLGGNPLSASNTLRGGDTATGIVGLMTYTWAGNSASGNAYRVRPINALNGSITFAPANPRPPAPEPVGGSLKVTGLNLLNFFNTFDGFSDEVDNCTDGVGGPPADCRGADDAAEFDRQWPKTVAAILGLQADVIGVIEIENDGYGPDSAIQFLVDRLNAATAPGTYAFIDVDAATGQTNALGTDAIKVGLLYKPASVTPVGATAALNTTAFVTGGDSADRNRPSLAQAFEQVSTGARFVVDVNHLKSKGSACDIPDAGDGQGNCNSVRTNAANLLAGWLASNPTGTGDSDILIIGDLNSYAKEDPITALITNNYANLIESFGGSEAYSYVFDGQWGYLDHALGSASLSPQVVGVTEWHINADEPSVLDYNVNFKSAGQIVNLYSPDQYRVSDHDPVLIGLDLDQALNLKQSARADLAALLPTGDKNTDKRFEKAIERIDQSLNPAWWATASTLDAQTGNHVFDRERQAVNELQKVLTGSFAEAAQRAIDKLVEADRQLAQVALNMAITGNGDSSRIAKAQEEMAQAAQETANGDFDQALQHYKKAWTEAIKAL